MEGSKSPSKELLRAGAWYKSTCNDNLHTLTSQAIRCQVCEDRKKKTLAQIVPQWAYFHKIHEVIGHKLRLLANDVYRSLLCLRSVSLTTCFSTMTRVAIQVYKKNTHLVTLTSPINVSTATTKPLSPNPKELSENTLAWHPLCTVM